MDWLYQIAELAVAFIGVSALVLIAIWMLDQVVTQIMHWRNIWDIYIELCLHRDKCKCGAVGKSRRERQDVESNHHS